MGPQPSPSYEDLKVLARMQAELVKELEQRLADQDLRLADQDLRLADQDLRLAGLAEQNQRLVAENEELRRRVGSNSSNSSRPPSSDSPYDRAKPKQSGLRGRSGRKPGKQPGEPGTTRRQVEDPDERIGVQPGSCRGCGAGLADADVVGVQRRQVFECSPPPPPRVIEYQVAARRCSCCGQVSYGQAPPGVSAPVQWGPGVQARAVLATLAHHLPYGRAAVLLRRLAGLEVSVGFLVAAR